MKPKTEASRPDAASRPSESSEKSARGAKRAVSLKTKLLISFLLLGALTVGLLWVFQIGLLNFFYRTVTSNRMSQLVSAVKTKDAADFTDFAAEAGNSDGVCSSIYEVGDGALYMVSDFHTDRGCFVHAIPDRNIVYLYGRTLASDQKSYMTLLSSKRLNKFYTERISAETTVALDGSIAEEDLEKYEPSQTEGDSLLCTAVFESGGKRYFALMSTPLIPISSTTKTLTFQLAIVTGAAVLFSLILALASSKRISDPLAKLSRAAALLPDGGFRKTGAVGCREIQELDEALGKAAEEISKVDALRRELIANVSHDLRTPLTLISGYGEMMRDLPGEATPENMQVIIDEANRLTGMVSELLDLSKLGAEMEAPSVTRFDACAFTAKLLGAYNAMAQAQGFRINFSHPDTPVNVEADESMIWRAMTNLVNNAFNHTGKSLTVDVLQSVEGDMLVTRVVDSGEGIAPEELDKIWDRYYRGSGPHRRGVIGSGLGLSITKRIFELNGCPYGVQSTPGKGSCFWFAMKIVP